METTSYKLKIVFTTSVLGTQPQLDVATKFITSKMADESGNLPADELGTLPEELEKGTTAFHKLDGQPIFYDYQVKGFLKEAGQVFNGKDGMPKSLRSKIDNLVFPGPRQIEIHLPDGAAVGFCERPLRAQTAQGPRTSLARSEEIPAGSWFECTLKVYPGEIGEKALRELLSYGADKGIGQWRNGGKGRFSFELHKEG